MADLELIEWATFRVHLLLPHDVAGSIISDKPTFPGVTVEDGTYCRDGNPFLRVERRGDHAKTHVTVRALEDVWLQEPALTAKVEGEGTWQGIGTTGRYTADSNGHKGPHDLGGTRDAFRSTLHWNHARSAPAFTCGWEHKPAPGGCYRFRTDGGFMRLLDNMPPGKVPWELAQVFSRPWRVEGVYPDKSGRALRRIELAGHGEFNPFQAWAHFSGWGGGPGVIVNAKGRTPPPGKPITEADGYNLLWDAPRSWRRLSKSQSISQTLSLRRL